MKYYDITPLVSEQLGVFPGDKPYKIDTSMSFENNDNIKLSAVSTTVHLGAHVDAPSHYHPEGENIAERSLDYYMGMCQVISVKTAMGQRIVPDDILKVKIQAPRVLFKTGSFPNPNNWNSDFCSLSAELIEELAEKGVSLVGIDTPSIDPESSKELPAHNKVYELNMAILEGVDLSEVPDGVYDLLALPLKLKGLDASPVRAILFETGALRL